MEFRISRHFFETIIAGIFVGLWLRNPWAGISVAWILGALLSSIDENPPPIKL